MISPVSKETIAAFFLDFSVLLFDFSLLSTACNA